MFSKISTLNQVCRQWSYKSYDGIKKQKWDNLFYLHVTFGSFHSIKDITGWWLGVFLAMPMYHLGPLLWLFCHLGSIKRSGMFLKSEVTLTLGVIIAQVDLSCQFHSSLSYWLRSEITDFYIVNLIISNFISFLKSPQAPFLFLYTLTPSSFVLISLKFTFFLLCPLTLLKSYPFIKYISWASSGLSFATSQTRFKNKTTLTDSLGLFWVVVLQLSSSHCVSSCLQSHCLHQLTKNHYS